jgi:hypothetical protein
MIDNVGEFVLGISTNTHPPPPNTTAGEQSCLSLRRGSVSRLPAGAATTHRVNVRTCRTPQQLDRVWVCCGAIRRGYRCTS